MPPHKIIERFEIPGDIKQIKKVSSKVIDILMRRNVEKPCIFDIRLSLEEAVINAIEHGNRKNPESTVEITFAIDEREAEIIVADKGEGFDHTALPDPTKNKNILREHGRGVFLIHKLMDRVEYNNKGNRVRLVKFLKRETGGDDAH